MKQLAFVLSLSLFAGAAFIGPASAVVPGVDGKGVPAISTCPSPSNLITVFHSDKIVFVIIGGLQAVLAADQLALNNLPRNVELDIKVRDNPRLIANLRLKVLSFLGASIDPASGNADKIVIREVEYTAVVCPKLP